MKNTIIEAVIAKNGQITNNEEFVKSLGNTLDELYGKHLEMFEDANGDIDEDDYEDFLPMSTLMDLINEVEGLNVIWDDKGSLGIRASKHGYDFYAATNDGKFLYGVYIQFVSGTEFITFDLLTDKDLEEHYGHVNSLIDTQEDFANYVSYEHFLHSTLHEITILDQFKNMNIDFESYDLEELYEQVQKYAKENDLVLRDNDDVDAYGLSFCYGF